MKSKLFAGALLLVAGTPLLLADTLVLTNGRRVQGDLTGVYGREIEFEERDGNRRRTIRVPRNEIARIEFEDDRSGFGGAGGFGGDRRDDRRTNDAGGVPRGMRERQINVSAREQWIDTGIDVRAGQSVYFAASGETRWGPNRRDGAAGEQNSPVNPGRPLPERPAAALIGRVGDGRDIFFIGHDTAAFRIRGNGRLFLGINDDVLTDNSGVLRVTISY